MYKKGIGLLIGIVSWINNAYAYDAEARVIRVVPIMEITSPSSRCNPNPYAASGNTQQNNYTGSVIGALTGGLLGAQVGKGNGQVAAAAIGAATGAIVGNNIGNNNVNQPAYVCDEIPPTNRVSSYSVTYQYDNREYVTTMPYDPGSRLLIDVQITPRY